MISPINIIWGSDFPTNLDKLLKLQKRVIRIITSSSYRCSAEPLFRQNNILNIYALNKVQVASFMYRHVHKQLPCVFNNIFRYINNVHEYRTRQCNTIHIPFVRPTKSQFSINVHGPRAWNSINNELKGCKPLGTLKKNI